MSIEPFDWFNRFFGNRPFGRRNSLFEGFDERRREMERIEIVWDFTAIIF